MILVGRFFSGLGTGETGFLDMTHLDNNIQIVKGTKFDDYMFIYCDVIIKMLEMLCHHF